MNTDEVESVFKDLGWDTMVNVDRYAEKSLSDRTVRVVYKVKDFQVIQKFEASNSLLANEFSTAVFAIHGEKKDANTMLEVDVTKTRFKEEVITKQQVDAACNRAIDWAMSVNIQERYKELCELAPSTPGAAGVWHLAALALTGGVDRIVAYRQRFNSGDRCGFVNFIDEEYIVRALAFAAPHHV